MNVSRQFERLAFWNPPAPTRAEMAATQGIDVRQVRWSSGAAAISDSEESALPPLDGVTSLLARRRSLLLQRSQKRKSQ
jgi:hypothetical protein